MEQRHDLLRLQRDFGITDDMYRSAASTLRVLAFSRDSRNENIVSQIDGTIVFVESSWAGPRPQAGETWLCNVRFGRTAYQSQPLMRIDASFLMGLGDAYRQEIYDALWRSNRRDFEKVFEARYREAALASAREQLEARHRDEVDALNAKVVSLETQLKQNRLMLNSRPRPDEIVLTSERVEAPEPPGPPAGGPGEAGRDRPPAIPATYRQPAPGIPDTVKSQGGPFSAPPTIVYDVRRVGENLIRSESFAEGRYFVHVSPNKKYLVVRPNAYGPVIAVNGCLHLGGLNRLSPFVGETRLLAEYSDRYGGMLISLRRRRAVFPLQPLQLVLPAHEHGLRICSCVEIFYRMMLDFHHSPINVGFWLSTE